ncbi:MULTISPECIES: F0F1 ATP synthase subunit gamma [Asticcacaulis]|uniref:F0F1 ATP synthase subunit gamma n=1 Tax=Asticcacaulis TaxID=76890 RepID=UPI001AE912DB|nr:MULTISPECIES: F0F1 ATP synthase subunit gamma [Asticcacaulis]MBP2160133.1 F-type H+-transporting ATPase subunit gamma [Asticcacaulis solisilvae]MDR6801178.1 F-type H+-transporting ATPase subunit gamma [Asticcacaulis sp. BE141]
MPSLKDMRNQIGSVKATQKITKAMQMVAAAKLKRATDAAENARPYAKRMASVIASLASRISGGDAPKMLAGTGSQTNQLVVVATADRGLAGGFNTAIVRAAREFIDAQIAQGRNVRIITIGRKGRDQLKRLYADRIVESHDLSGTKVLTLDVVAPISEQITAEFNEGRADVVTLFYSQFKSVISQIPASKRLIPAEIDATAEAGKSEAVYEYEPSEEEILEVLLPRNLSVQLLSALFENNAGFYAAQMSAMDNATRNAGEMIKALQLKYNRSRQAQITKELIEIISGAEAL